ncbi:hypothetical protein [Planctomycetes bacterium Poly30]
MALHETLRAIRTAFEEGPTPAEDIRVLDAHVEALRSSGLAERAIRAGTRAPDFAMRSTCGRTLALGELLANGPVVLTWFRGNW